jgi:hypothetical protein
MWHKWGRRDVPSGFWWEDLKERHIAGRKIVGWIFKKSVGRA